MLQVCHMSKEAVWGKSKIFWGFFSFRSLKSWKYQKEAYGHAAPNILVEVTEEVEDNKYQSRLN